MDVIDEAMRVFGNHRILVNTLSENTTNPYIKQNIQTVNKAIKEKCKCIPQISKINSMNLTLKDNIHFTAASVKIIASKVLDSVHNKNV